MTDRRIVRPAENAGPLFVDQEALQRVVARLSEVLPKTPFRRRATWTKRVLIALYKSGYDVLPRSPGNVGGRQ